MIGLVLVRVMITEGNGWKGIIFGSTEIPTTFNNNGKYQSGSVIKFIDIIRAGYRT